MAIKITRELRDAMREISRKFGALGGKASARNMTPEERSARAKKASDAAARKRTAQAKSSAKRAKRA
jgi:hypothetical protein